MLNWLARLLKKPDPADARVTNCRDEILPFLHAAKASIDQHDLMIPRKHALIYCFALGCVAASTVGKQLDETGQLAVIVQVMQRLSSFDPQQGSGMLGQVMTLLRDEEGQRAHATGLAQFTKWQAGDRRAANLLADYLRHVAEPA